MIGNRDRAVSWLMVVVLAAAMLAWPSVGSESGAVLGWRGYDVVVPLNLVASEGTAIATLTGQLNYDPTAFSNPRIGSSLAAQGFVVLGQEMEPGRYRFALYAKPMQALVGAQLRPALTIALRVDAVGACARMLTYSFETASGPNGTYLSDVHFQPVIAVLNRNAARHWPRYE